MGQFYELKKSVLWKYLFAGYNGDYFSNFNAAELEIKVTIYKIVIYISPGIGDRDPTRIESDNCPNRYSNFDYGTGNPDFWGQESRSIPKIFDYYFRRPPRALKLFPFTF